MRIRLAAVLAAFALVTACSSADPSGSTLGGNSNDQTEGANTTKNGTNKNTGSTSNNTGTTSTTNPTDPTNPTNPTNPTTPGDGAKCAAEATFQACDTCCTGGNDAVFDKAYQAFDDCACKTPGVCAQACAKSVCAGQDPDQACDTCLQQNGAQCNTAAKAACDADAACKAASACEVAAKCEDKQ